jgi:hypothetical protein
LCSDRPAKVSKNSAQMDLKAALDELDLGLSMVRHRRADLTWIRILSILHL